MLNFKKLIFFIILLPLSSILLSCSASTTLTSWKDPYYAKKVSKICVFTLIKDIEVRKTFETEIAYSLKQIGVPAITSMSILAPKVKYTNEQMQKMFEDHNVDAILTLKYSGTKETTVHYSGFYDWYSWGWGYMYSPGYTEVYRSVKVGCTLFSVSSGKEIWIASTRTENYWSLDDLASSLGDELAYNLHADKMVK
jgi:cellobiose-specific phosphotransferase system component IIB